MELKRLTNMPNVEVYKVALDTKLGETKLAGHIYKDGEDG